MTTGFFWDERCFWHGGGYYAGMLPVGGLVQPMASGGLPESPETKRRLKNLIDVTGLSRDLALQGAPMASDEDLLRVHPQSYLSEFKTLSDGTGGELGRRTPFGPGGYEMAVVSTGLSIGALDAVLRLYLAPERLTAELPALRQLTRELTDIQACAARICAAFERQLGHRADYEVVACGNPDRARAQTDRARCRAGLGRAPRQRDRGDILRRPRYPDDFDPSGTQLPDGHRRFR